MRMKKKALITASCAFALTLFTGALCVNASASAPASFEMTGSSVRFRVSEDIDDSGIRYRTLISCKDYADLEELGTVTEVGTLVIPTDLLGGKELELGNYQVAKQEKC